VRRGEDERGEESEGEEKKSDSRSEQNEINIRAKRRKERWSEGMNLRKKEGKKAGYLAASHTFVLRMASHEASYPLSCSGQFTRCFLLQQSEVRSQPTDHQ
jgi:hypothetical protein